MQQTATQAAQATFELPTSEERPLSLVEPAPSPAAHIAELPASSVANPHRLLELAIERGMPVETVASLLQMAERFEQMQERERARRAESAYIRAISDLKAQVVTVVKTKRVNYPTKDRDGRASGSVDFKHAELSDIMEAIAPAAARVGLTWNFPKVEQGSDWVSVTCRLRHVDGHFEDLTMGGPVDNSGKKNALQAIQSSVTYLSRYTLKTLLGISEKGDDDDGAGAAPPRDDAASVAAPQMDDAAILKNIEAGNAAAARGLKSLTAWWSALTEAQRKELTPHFGGMKKAAAAVKAAA